MNSRERFLIALKGGKPDRVPVLDFLGGIKIFRKVLGKDIDKPTVDDMVDCAEKIGFDAVIIEDGGFWNVEDSVIGNTYKDEWGVTYKNIGYSWPFDGPSDYPVKNQEGLDIWIRNKPDPYLPARIDGLKRALEISKGEFTIIGEVAGPLTIATLVLGFDGLLIRLVKEPDFIEEIFKTAYDFYNVAIDRICEARVDAIMVAEDLGFNTALFASPQIYRKHLFPYLFSMFDRINKKDMPIILHSDGNLNEILDDIVGAGIAGLNPVEKKANMDIGKIRKRYGNRLCLIGNIDSSGVLVNGPVSKIISDVKQAIETAGKDGAYVLGGDGGYHDGIPTENYIAMIRAAKEFGKYY